MRRHLIAFVAAICLAGAVVMLVSQGWESVQRSIVFSGLVRAGVTLAALWLAYPQVEAIVKRLSPTWVAVAILLLVLVIARPRSLLYVMPALAFVAALAWLARFLKQP